MVVLGAECTAVVAGASIVVIAGSAADPHATTEISKSVIAVRIVAIMWTKCSPT